MIFLFNISWYFCSIFLKKALASTYILFHLPVFCHSYLRWDISWYICSIFLDILVQYFSISLYVHIIPSSSCLPFLSAVRYFLKSLFNISQYHCSVFLKKPQPLHIIPSSGRLPFLSAVRYFSICILNVSQYFYSIFINLPQPLHIIPSCSRILPFCHTYYLLAAVKYFLIFLFNISQLSLYASTFTYHSISPVSHSYLLLNIF